MTAHAQKPDFVFRRNGRVHLNRRGASVQSTTGSRGVRISGSNAGYTIFRGSVKSTGYPLHSPVSPSFPLPCVTVCHHISTRLYLSVPYTVYINGLQRLSIAVVMTSVETPNCFLHIQEHLVILRDRWAPIIMARLNLRLRMEKTAFRYGRSCGYIE